KNPHLTLHLFTPLTYIASPPVVLSPKIIYFARSVSRNVLPMPFYFKKAEKPGHAIRRVCREHIARALFRLRKSRHPAAIHAVRKEIKKLRAILRLVQGDLHSGDHRKLEKSLRRAA